MDKKELSLHVLAEVRRLVDLYQSEDISITVTSHSLGASLATLCAADIAQNGYNKPSASSSAAASPVTAFVFASPRVGDALFKRALDELTDLRLLHVSDIGDIVPKYPFIGYADVGELLEIDTAKSPYVKTPDLWTSHSIDGYLHGVAGTRGSKGKFKLVVDRDLALLNKSRDELKAEYRVPILWWEPSNKGMVQLTNGKWKLHDHEDDP